MKLIDVNSGIYKKRIKKLKSELKKKSFGIFIVLKDENIYYLTGFYGKDSGSIFIISNEKSYLLVNFIYLEDALNSVDKDEVEVILYKKDRFKKASEVLSGLKSKKAVVESSEIGHKSFLLFQEMIERSNSKLYCLSGIVETLRVLKDEYEIKKIKKACNITDLAFNSILDIPPNKISNMPELLLSVELEKAVIENGGYGRSFDFIVASGENSSKPHYLSEHRPIGNGLLLLDFGVVYQRYSSDITRTIFINKNSVIKKFIEIYKIVLEAQLKSIQACREGIRCDELDKIARKHIEKSGYGNHFGHSLGHGVGLEIHEDPGVRPGNKTVLKENMVITIEPGIYIPDIGGVRIEDMVIIGKNGCENLYKSKKDFTFLS
jgi:Xaa-Pro aminopeptidase